MRDFMLTSTLLCASWLASGCSGTTFSDKGGTQHDTAPTLNEIAVPKTGNAAQGTTGAETPQVTVSSPSVASATGAQSRPYGLRLTSHLPQGALNLRVCMVPAEKFNHSTEPSSIWPNGLWTHGYVLTCDASTAVVMNNMNGTRQGTSDLPPGKYVMVLDYSCICSTGGGGNVKNIELLPNTMNDIDIGDCNKLSGTSVCL